MSTYIITNSIDILRLNNPPLNSIGFEPLEEFNTSIRNTADYQASFLFAGVNRLPARCATAAATNSIAHRLPIAYQRLWSSQ